MKILACLFDADFHALMTACGDVADGSAVQLRQWIVEARHNLVPT